MNRPEAASFVRRSSDRLLAATDPFVPTAALASTASNAPPVPVDSPLLLLIIAFFPADRRRDLGIFESPPPGLLPTLSRPDKLDLLFCWERIMDGVMRDGESAFL